MCESDSILQKPQNQVHQAYEIHNIIQCWGKQDARYKLQEGKTKDIF